jgi:hypothetical protein
MKRTSIVLVALLLVLASTANAGTRRDYDPGFDFSTLKTWAWMEGTPAPSELAEKRIRNAIESQLAQLGFTQASGEPDFYVATHAALTQQTRIDIDNFGYRGWRGWGTSTANVSTIPVGVLMVDMVDAGEKQLIWRGVTSGYTASNPEKSEKRINKAVARLFKKFPPTAK